MGLTYSSVIDASIEEVFAWHRRPGAITRMLPPWLPVRLVREAPSVRDGEAVLALPGGLRWVAGHEPHSYDPPRQFADALRPPLSVMLRWEHRHLFAPSGEHGTLVTDVVDATAPATMAGIRTVQVRTGIVQTPHRGVLRLMYPLFAAGLGGPLGDGAQWFAWIGIDDLLDIYLRAVTDRALAGPVNAVAPHQVRNAEYATTLGRVLGRPAVLPVPAVGPRLLLGAEGASELADASQRVCPAALAAAGHRFRYPRLEGALRHVLGRDPVPAATAKVAMAPIAMRG